MTPLTGEEPIPDRPFLLRKPANSNRWQGRIQVSPKPWWKKEGSDMIYRISRNNLTPSSSACLGLCWKSPSDLRGFWWPRHDRSSPSPSGRTGCTICHGILRKGRVNSGHQVDTGRAFMHFQDTLTCQCQIRMRHRTLLLWKWQRHWHQRRESWIRNIATVDTPFQQVFGQVIASTSVCRGSEEKHVKKNCWKDRLPQT